MDAGPGKLDDREFPDEGMLRSRLRLRQLRLLVALDDHRNLRRAAASLPIAQPAASRLLQEVEALFGRPLFERHARGMEPNAFGEILVRHARTMLLNLGQARDELESLRAGTAGTVSVGAIMAAIPALLVRSIAQLRESSPRLRVRIQAATSDFLLPALREGSLDLALARPTQEECRGIRFELLVRETVCVLAAADHPLARRRKLTLRDLTDYGWILHPPASPLRGQIDLLFQRAGLPLPDGRIETSSLLATTCLLPGTPLLAAVPIDAARQFDASAALRVLPVPFDVGLGSYGIATLEGQQLSPACLRFIEVLRKEAGRRIARNRRSLAGQHEA